MIRLPGIVISPILDENIEEHLLNSEIWSCAFVPEDVTEEVKKKYSQLYKYEMEFEGIRPVKSSKPIKLLL